MSGILNAFFGGNYGAKPGAPTVGTATATGTTTATLTFSAPSSDGGLPITSYTATSSPGGITSTLYQSGGGTFSITGLTTGTAYTFSVTATNAIGTSASSGASNSITTYAVPTNTVAPVVSGTATYGQTLSTTNGTWTGVPSSFSYGYQWQRGGSDIGGATGSTYQLTSSDVGYTIRCVVTATNSGGSTAANSNSTATVVAYAPSAPQSVSATATGSSTATVSWSAPADTGGAAISTYSIYWSGGSTTTGSTSVGIGGLSPSTSYTFTVYATNSAGTGPGATSNSITTSQARGCATYTTPGCYTFTVPAGVYSVTVGFVTNGTMGQGNCYYTYGGTGGSVRTYNNISVSPGQTFSVKVPSNVWPTANCYYTNYARIGFPSGAYMSYPYGAEGSGLCSSLLYGGLGGSGGSGVRWGTGGGGGAGGVQGQSPCYRNTRLGGAGARQYYTTAGCGYGGGGGGGGRGSQGPSYCLYVSGAGGGGTNALYYGWQCGAVASGGATNIGGSGGAGGSAGGNSGTNGWGAYGGGGWPGNGGNYGGGLGGYYYSCVPSNVVSGGAIVRFIWPGNLRYYPTTCLSS